MALATIEAPRPSRVLEKVYKVLDRKTAEAENKPPLQYFSPNDSDVIAMILPDIRERLGILSDDQELTIVEFVRGNNGSAIERSKAIELVRGTGGFVAPNEVFIVTQRQNLAAGVNAFIYTPQKEGEMISAVFRGAMNIEKYKPPRMQNAEPLQTTA